MYNRQKLPCEVCGRLVISRYKYDGIKMCTKHYRQAKKYGKVLDTNPRTCHDLNSFKLVGDTAIFEVYNHKCEPVAEFLVDKDDLPLVRYKKWCLSNTTGYIVTGNNIGANKRISLHLFLLHGEVPSNFFIDHINNNKLDNRRCNLRETTIAQNAQNKSLQTGDRKNTSGVAGVCWSKSRNMFEVEIRYNNKRLHLSRFFKFQEAVYVRFVAEIILFKEYRHTGNDSIIYAEIENIDIARKYELIAYVVSRVSQIYQQ